MSYSRLAYCLAATLFLLHGTTPLTAADSVLTKPYVEEGEVTLGSPVELAVARNEVFGHSWDLVDVKPEKIHVCESTSAIPCLLDEQPNQDSCWLCVPSQKVVNRIPYPQPTDLIQEPACGSCEAKVANDGKQECCPCELYNDVEPVSSETVVHVQPPTENRYEHRFQEKELELQWKEEAMEALLEARSEVFQAQLEAMEGFMNLKAESLKNEAKIKEEALEAVLAVREESFQTKLESQKQLIESQSQVLRMQATIVSLQQKIGILEAQLKSKQNPPTIELPPR